MAIPSNYVRLKNSDIGKTFGIDFEPLVYFKKYPFNQNVNYYGLEGNFLTFESGNYFNVVKVVDYNDVEMVRKLSYFKNGQEIIIFENNGNYGSDRGNWYMENLDLNGEKLSRVSQYTDLGVNDTFYVAEIVKAKNIKLKDKDIILYPQTKITNILNEDGTPYNPPKPVVANPTLSGSEAELKGLEVDGTKYKLASGGGEPSEIKQVGTAGGYGSGSASYNITLNTTIPFNKIHLFYVLVEASDDSNNNSSFFGTTIYYPGTRALTFSGELRNESTYPIYKCKVDYGLAGSNISNISIDLTSKDTGREMNYSVTIYQLA